MFLSQSGRVTRALFLPFLCCLCAGLVLSGSARAASSEHSIPATESPKQLTEREALALAQYLLGQDQREKAVALYQILADHARNPEYRIEAAFQLAGIAMSEGKYRKAAVLYQGILNGNPNLPRVRLELARVYFLDKNYEDATFQFELVRGSDLPPEVLQKVDAFLDAIRRQKDWTLDFFLTPVSDSNISQASGGREECIGTVFGTLCRPLEAKESGYGLSGGGTANYFKRFSQDWGLRATLEFSGLAYENSDYNDHTLHMALGPRRLWESGEASLQPTFRKRWYGDKEYSRSYGMRLDARQNFGRLILEGGASWEATDYDNPYVQSVLQGQSWGGVYSRATF